MTSILNVAIPILGGIFVLGGLLFINQGLGARRRAGDGAYGVARQEARQEMLVAFIRAVFLFIVGLILFGIFGLSPGPEESPAPPAPSPTSTVQAEQTATVTAAPTNTPSSPDTATPLPIPTLTLTPTLEATSTSAVPTAVVNSPNGLWLREAPGGTQEVELIADGSTLTLLAGRETVDDLEWQQVRTPAGNEGWVAVDFIIYQ